MSRILVVVTDDRFGDDYAEEHAVLDPLGMDLRVVQCSTPSDVSASCGDADGLLVNLAPVDASVLHSLPRCRGIVRYGVGLDNVDRAAAREVGIPIRNVPGYCDDEVAEHALALLLDCARSTTLRDRLVRGGGWNLKSKARRVAGRTLGVLGFGGIARAFIRRSLGLGFRQILVWSPTLNSGRLDVEQGDDIKKAAQALGTEIRAAAFDELLSLSDFLSVHVPYVSGAAPLLGKRELGKLPHGAVLVNTARGALVDEAALAAALKSGKLAAAGLDVFREEPLPSASPLRGLPNIVLTDHAAWYSEDSIRVLRSRAAAALTKLLEK
jgi:D-3-phosphoglycerate dehydrogenase / 2-oxoglutarate reductase